MPPPSSLPCSTIIEDAPESSSIHPLFGECLVGFAEDLIEDAPESGSSAGMQSCWYTSTREETSGTSGSKSNKRTVSECERACPESTLAVGLRIPCSFIHAAAYLVLTAFNRREFTDLIHPSASHCQAGMSLPRRSEAASPQRGFSRERHTRWEFMRYHAFPIAPDARF